MLTYSLEERGNEPIYEFLYEKIRNDILAGALTYKSKLPSKRNFAKQLGVSVITVENAYAQLMAEGYIYSIPKSGFYVDDVAVSSAILYSGKGSGRADQHKGSGLLPDTVRTLSEEGNENEGTLSKGHGSCVPGSAAAGQSPLFYEGQAPLNTRPQSALPALESPYIRADFVNNRSDLKTFPFSVWSSLSRETLSSDQQKLLTRAPFEGIWDLRVQICRHLKEFRSMSASPEQVIVGAGTEYLYSLLIQLLGRDRVYAAEDPGYRNISRIYEANGVLVKYIPLDRQGMDVKALEKSGADIVHISPGHHYPTGIVTPIGRRIKLLEWAGKTEGRYIIEDDYDSEFRMTGRPLPTLCSIDSYGKVIYMNTFSKSLSQTIRISYMVLPWELLEKFRRELDFYSCTVSNLEQYTLAKFIERGYFEKHINRMRNHYRDVRNALLEAVSRTGNREDIVEGHSGLHFLLRVNTDLTDEELVKKAAEAGILISALSGSYHDPKKAPQHTLIINYSGLDAEEAPGAVQALYECIDINYL